MALALIIYRPRSPGAKLSWYAAGSTRFVGPSDPGTPIAEVAAVAAAVHFASEAAAQAYLDARTTTNVWGTQWVTLVEGVAVLS